MFGVYRFSFAPRWVVSSPRADIGPAGLVSAHSQWLCPPGPLSRRGSRCPRSRVSLSGSQTPSHTESHHLMHPRFSERSKNKVFKIQEDISAKQGLGEDSPCGHISSRQQRTETECRSREARSPCPWVSLVEIRLTGKAHLLKMFGSFLGDHESARGSVRFSEYTEPTLEQLDWQLGQ